MNLNEDFINIQGIIISAEKSSESLKRIKHRGGNESIILDVISELYKYLSSKNYIKNKKINEIFDDKLTEICIFLIINTEVKQAVNDSQFEHLVNIMPQLSPCLLANVVIGLELSPNFCKALSRFDVGVVEEILVEIIPCLKKCKPKVHIKNAQEYLKLIILKLTVKNEKWSESCEKLCDAASQILLNLRGLHGDEAQTIKIDTVYECMGLTVLSLLDLLLNCDEKNNSLIPVIEKILKTCCSIMMAVTLDVFCLWAEVENNGENLQSIIAEKSYMFLNKYGKNPLAKELVGMLGTIARKPRSVNELILQADVPKMISVINRGETEQKRWFSALLNTQVLDCEESMKCIDRWAHLCTTSDVTLLINMGVVSKNPRAKKLVIKCASTLELSDLVLVTIQHFYRNGITNFNDNINQELVFLFNKIKDKSDEDIFCKELHLLLLQNPEQTLTHVFSECLKNTFYSNSLMCVWPNLKQVLTIENFGINLLNKEITNNPPSEQTCRNHSELFNALIKSEIFRIETILLVMIVPLLQSAYQEANYQLLKNELEIIKDLQGHIFVKEETEPFFLFILDIMKNCRCKFMTFDPLKQQVVRQIVDVIENKCCNVSYTANPNIPDDFFVSFYYKKLFQRECNTDVLKHFFPIDFKNNPEIIAHLIRILPLCVTPEWIMLSRRLINLCGVKKSIELLCDVIILLCQIIKSQKTKTNELECMLSALKYYLQNVGVVAKECFQLKVTNQAEDVTLTKNICRLLKEIPTDDLKREEGLSLANLLSDPSLMHLKSDKQFACLVASIHEPHVCKMILDKMLN